MKLGIISDTHDNLDAVDEAVRFLNREEVVGVVHAGDVISPFAAARFTQLDSTLWVVYGNNDGDRRLLRSRFKEMGAEVEDFLEFELGEKKIAVYHGTHTGVLRSLADSGRYDVVVSGHTHRSGSDKRGKTLSINPGEACGYLTGKRSLCVLDLDSLEPRFVEF